jgi:indolepyruvate ferredoxin oxidoreductase
LIADYEATVETLLQTLTPENHGLAVEIASIPEQIRGFGHVKDANIACARSQLDELVAAYRDPQTAAVVSAAE